MAKRPEGAKGSLIFQEGKKIDDQFFIVAVYDDPDSCSISFSAYDLEDDKTYTYPLCYRDFDNLFKFDSELMNPSNVDGRYHWVIERLDFVQNAMGQKVLCLANEPTPEGDEEEEEEIQQPKAAGLAPAAAGAGKVDAATRARLLKELDTHDDAKLHRGLVKSEGARKKFLSELFAKRQLEQLKAQERLQKADEEREARLNKIEVLKKQQQQKAQQHRDNEEAKKSTRAQLDVLMKQKEAQAIRRLIQEKDEQDRGMGREKDAARHRRKMQERSAAEVQAFENQRAQQLARKREEQVAKRDKEISAKDKEEAMKVRKRMDEDRLLQVKRREEKDRMIAERWADRAAELGDKDKRREQFEQLEDKRNTLVDKAEHRFALREKERWDELRELEHEKKDTTDMRRRNLWKDILLRWQLDASKRAVGHREDDKRNVQRVKKLREKEDLRLRKFRETQFLDTMRKGELSSPKAGGEDDGGSQGSRSPSPTSKADQDNWSKSFEEQDRQRRHAEREAKKKQEDSKKSKVEKLGAQNPNVIEMQRIADWRKQMEKKKEDVEKARLNRELAEEKAAKDQLTIREERADKFETLEKKRRAASQEREVARNKAVIARTQNVPIGTALPMAALIF